MEIRPFLDHLYSNLYDVYNGLKNRYVKGALVDAYALGSQRHLFNNLEVTLQEIYDYSSAYGIVLAGEAKKLQTCFREYVSENRSEIFRVIERHVHVIEVCLNLTIHVIFLCCEFDL